MKTEELNEYYTLVRIRWNPNGILFIVQPDIFHTINEALIRIRKLSYINHHGQYHIVTPYCKYEVTNVFEMECKKIETFS